MNQGRSSRGQRGNALVFALLALVVTGLGAAAMLKNKNLELKRQAGEGEASILATLQGGVNTLISNEWQDFQSGNTVSYGGQSVVPATVGGVLTWQPTVTQLKSMGVLPTGWTTTTSRVNGAAYQVAIVRTPAGCSGAACSVEGRIWANGAYTVGSKAGTMDGPVVGPILAKLGADAGVSLPGSASSISGYGGAWSVTNPVTGTPAGVVMVRAGTAAAAFAQFVRIGDTRDPSLQGNLTVGGDTTLKGDATVAGTLDATGAITSDASISATTGTCARASMNAAGDIVSRDASCVRRVDLSGVNGTAIARDSAGTARAALLGSSGQVVAYNSAGTATVTLDGAGGRASASLLRATASASAGASCSGYAEGDLVMDAQAYGTVLACRSGYWRRGGLQVASQSGSCSTAGAVAMDTSDRALICRSGYWRLLNDRVTSVVPIATYSGNGAGTVPAPSCGTGGSPDVALSPLEAGADYGGSPPRNRFSLVTSWTGSGWSVSPVLVDSNGNAYSSSFTGTAYSFAWMATTLCNYGSGN